MAVILNNPNIIYLHPEKTGGVSISEFLITALSKSLIEYDRGKKHITLKEIKQRYPDNYFTIISVRNPYDRVLSFYLYYLSKAKLTNISFKDFVTSGNFLIYMKPIHKYAKKNEVDHIIRFENINKSIDYLKQKFDIKQDLYHLNSTKHVNYTEYYTSEMYKAVNRFLKDDFIEFDYKMRR